MPCSWCYYTQSVKSENKLLTSVFSESFLSLYQNFYALTSPFYTVFSGTLLVISLNPAWTPLSHTGMLPFLPIPHPLTFFYSYYFNSKPAFILYLLSLGPSLVPMYLPLADEGTGLRQENRDWISAPIPPQYTIIHNGLDSAPPSPGSQNPGEKPRMILFNVNWPQHPFIMLITLLMLAASSIPA